MNEKLNKQIKTLKIYSGFLTVALIAITCYLLFQNNSNTFDEISVERINIVEENGDLKLVISNSKRQHSSVINGMPLPERDEAYQALKRIIDNDERRAAYLKIKEDGLLPEDRMFVGKRVNNDVGLFINDTKGIPRIKIYIDKDDNPKIELLDEEVSLLLGGC